MAKFPTSPRGDEQGKIEDLDYKGNSVAPAKSVTALQNKRAGTAVFKSTKDAPSSDSPKYKKGTKPGTTWKA